MSVATAATLLIGIATLISALAALYSATRAGDVAKGAREDVAAVHTLVNDRATKQDERIDQLGATLTAAKMQIPPRPGTDTPPLVAAPKRRPRAVKNGEPNG